MSRAATAEAGPAPELVLRADNIEAIAARVAELLQRPAPKLLKAHEVAHILDVEVSFVYAHQIELGVLRLPSRGRRPALRFDRDTVLELLRRRAEQPRPASRRRLANPRRATEARGVELLPYEPRSAA